MPESGEDKLQINTIYVRTASGQTITLKDDGALMQQYSGQDVVLHITNDHAEENGDHTYTYDVYTKVTPVRTMTSYKRSWSYSVHWSDYSITTKQPNDNNENK